MGCGGAVFRHGVQMIHYQPVFWPTAELSRITDTRNLRVAGTVFDTAQQAADVLREQMRDVDQYELPVTPCVVHCNDQGEVIRIVPIRSDK
jgi:hypothetical protein